jgi:hypothetical protein
MHFCDLYLKIFFIKFDIKSWSPPVVYYAVCVGGGAVEGDMQGIFCTP